MKQLLKNTAKHWPYFLMALPVVIILFLFAYVPMAGLVMAFKKLDYQVGIWNKMVADMYENGKGTEKDSAKAEEWRKK